jgi:rubrerythrin
LPLDKGGTHLLCRQGYASATERLFKNVGKEVDMKLESLNDVLTFAIRREHDARELYLMFRDMVKDPGAKALLEDLANQELGHRNLLENALKGGKIDRIGGKKEAKDLHLGEYMVTEAIGPDSSPQDVMLFAIKKEQEAYSIYHMLLGNYEGTELEELFSRLVKEELHHKETLEREYEEHFMQWM